jgi:hypothetical protein
MKLFGIFNVETKEEKELTAEVAKLNLAIEEMREEFPFDLGQIVYDVQLKNNKGKFAKTDFSNLSLEYSTITAVEVDRKNYFNLVERYYRQDVFKYKEEAEKYLKHVCTC